jgi:GH24 family phage-related lysozyme (muramidase)
MNDLERNERVTRRGVTFVTRWEGFVEIAYWDRNRWSIGYGTISFEGEGPIDEDDAWRRLRQHLNQNVVPYIPRHRIMEEHERDALGSFGYNNGIKPLIDTTYSTLARRLKSHEGQDYADRKEIYRDELPRWTSPGSPFEAGLTKRRAAEVALAVNADYSGRP